ncbi:MAG: hypothetical protein WBD31_23625 [Rubripirellula sp.]
MSIRSLMLVLMPLATICLLSPDSILMGAECSKPIEWECSEDPFETVPCTQQECIPDINEPGTPMFCELYSYDTVYNSNATYHAGLETVQDPNDPGHFYWNHGTIWCQKDRACVWGAHCVEGDDDKHFCKPDTTAQWVPINELFYTGVGEVCEITEI